MIAILIFALAVGALLQFFISYCRSLIISYSEVVLSQEAREWTALQPGPVRGEDFGRLLGLLRSSHVPGDDSAELGVARLYYLLVSALHSLCPARAQLRQAFANERGACAHMLAVAVERRLTVGGGSL